MGEIKASCGKCGARGASLEFRHVYTPDGHEVEIYCLICGYSLGMMPIKVWEERMSKIGDCKACGKKRVSLPARNLCKVCWDKARAAEKAAEMVEPVGVLIEEDVADESVVAMDEDQGAAVVDRSAAGFPSVLDDVLADLRSFLIAKNQAYGNSALEPVRVFSKADPVEQLRVRIDDKLSRLFRGEAAGEDTELDLLGYLTLLQVARRWPCTSAVTSVVSK